MTVESDRFDEGVNQLLNHSLSVINYLAPEKGASRSSASANLAATTQKVLELTRSTSPTEFTAMQEAARLLLKGVVDEYEAKVANG